MRVRKRTGEIIQWDERKIVRAMLGAFQEVNSEVIPDVTPIVNAISKAVHNASDETGRDLIEIEDVQTIVEESLMIAGHLKTAKAYVIFRHERAKQRQEGKQADSNAIADYIHLSKYARHREDLGRREVYSETVDRVLSMHKNKYWPKGKQVIETMEEAFKFVYDKQVLPSMRSMQFAGPALEQHNARMYNCAFTLVDRPRVFQETFYLLLCGCGVGFSVQWCHVEKLPTLARINKKKVHHFTVPDTIEGWADAVGALFKGHLEGYYVEFNYSFIRPEGTPLKTSGGLAPGHVPLKETLVNVRGILDKAQGRQLRPIECHDIFCHIAEGVLAGGIRRSSLISLFSPEDTEMMYCKASGNFDPMTGKNGQRSMANNSAVLLRSRNDKETFERVIRIAQEGFGEPGFFFTDNLDYGTNPCGEIGLNPVLTLEYPEKNFPEKFKIDEPGPHGTVQETGFSFCNLCEVNAAACKTELEFYNAVGAATIIGTLQAGYTSFPYLGRVTEEICKRDALLGVGITGMMDNPEIALSPRIQKKAAQGVVKLNKMFAALIGINFAQRAATVKPSGTASLALGCIGSGIHDHHAKRYFRRVTANPIEPVAQYFVKHNPHMVERKPNGDWALVFPVKAPSGAGLVKETPAMEFIDRVLSTYDHWISFGMVDEPIDAGLTHNVSCTVTLRDGEMAEVVERIWSHRMSIAAMSFVPLSLDKKYPFAPREAIETQKDKDRWDNIVTNYVKVDYSEMEEGADTVSRRSLEAACSGGTCEL